MKKDATLKTGCMGDDGYTLVELMISIVVSAVVVIAAISTHSLMSKAYSSQSQIVKMQQSLRGALHVLAWDTHNALRDPSPQQQFRFTNNNRWVDINGNIDNTGQPSIEYQSLRLDNNNDGVAETAQTITYMVRDDDGDGIPGLYRQVNPPDPAGVAGYQLVADGVQAISYAFAVDTDGDGVLERFNDPISPRVLWVIDSDNGGNLDAVLDTNNDGFVTFDDDTDGNGVIEPADDWRNHMATPALYRHIRAVRFYILLQASQGTDQNYIDRKRYAVGGQVIDSPNDRFQRKTMTLDVTLRNYIR